MKLTAIIFLLILTGSNFLKDQENSFDKAKKESLKVGVVTNPPYAIFKNGNAQGTEIDLLKNFARVYDLQIQFSDGSESKLVEKIKKYQIYIIAGGFDKKAVWKKHAGTSATYDSNIYSFSLKGKTN